MTDYDAKRRQTAQKEYLDKVAQTALRKLGEK